VGLVGAGDNTRRRHIPGLRAQPGVELVAVCNRRPESTQTVARDFAIPRTFARWQDLVADPDVDAVLAKHAGKARQVHDEIVDCHRPCAPALRAWATSESIPSRSRSSTS